MADSLTNLRREAFVYRVNRIVVGMGSTKQEVNVVSERFNLGIRVVKDEQGPQTILSGAMANKRNSALREKTLNEPIVMSLL